MATIPSVEARSAELDTALFERNLEALAERTAELAKRLRQARPDAGPQHSESPEAAGAALATFRPTPGAGVAGMGPPIFVLGAGGGGRVRALLRDRLSGTSRQPVVVMEPDPGRLAAAMSLADWTDLIRDPLVRWAVGADSIAAAREAFGNDPCFWFQEASFVAGDPRTEALLQRDSGDNRWKRFLAAASDDLQRSIAALESLRDDLRTFRAARPALSALKPGEARIFGFTDVNTSALKFIYRDLLEAAARAGHPVTLHEENYLSDPFRAHRRARAFLEAKPDLLLCLIQSGWQAYGPLGEGVPAAVYYSSDPDRYALDTAKFTPRDHVFVADPAWVETLRARGVVAEVLPLATSMHHSEIPPDADGWACEAVIVGNLTGPDHVLPDASAEVLAEVGRLGERLARDPRLSADGVVAGSPLASVEGADRRMARAVEVAVTYSLRRHAAVLLAEAGIDLCIYGNGLWRTALAGTAAAERYRRPLDYRREVPAAYHYARVVVNVGSVNAPQALNMRAFDVPAVRGCLVTDNRRGVHLAFAADREIVVYDRIADLPAIVKGLLADQARRDAIAAAGRARVLQSHTYDRRWATMFAACTKAS